MTAPFLWRRGLPSSDSGGDSGGADDSESFLIPNVWGRRSLITNELVHAYQRAQSLDLGVDYIFRVQAQYPWRITSQTNVLIISALTEGRP